jgi:hypothetical protein
LSLEPRRPECLALHPWPLHGPHLDLHLPLSSSSAARRIRLERRSPKPPRPRQLTDS